MKEYVTVIFRENDKKIETFLLQHIKRLNSNGKIGICLQESKSVKKISQQQSHHQISNTNKSQQRQTQKTTETKTVEQEEGAYRRRNTERRNQINQQQKKEAKTLQETTHLLSEIVTSTRE